MSQTWNWLLYDVPDNREFLLALEHLFPQDSFLVLEFVAVPDSLAREISSLGLRLPKDCTLASKARKTGCSRGCTLNFWLTRHWLRLVFGSEKRWANEVRLHLEHVHVMRNQTYLMIGYDLGTDDGFVVTQSVPEEEIERFCTRVSCSYKRTLESM